MGYRDDLAAGRVAFAHLIRLWHERNGWSHRVLPALAEALDLGRVHNSQISMLRNGKLASPGPEVFLALGRANQLLADQVGAGGLSEDLKHRLQERPEVLEALASSALFIHADGDQLAVFGPGEFLEVFVGLRPPPPSFDLNVVDTEAARLSAALAHLLTRGQPWRQCRDSVLAAYAVDRQQRRERFIAVMAGLRDYSAAELEAELPDLWQTARTLGVKTGAMQDANGFLVALRTDQARRTHFTRG